MSYVSRTNPLFVVAYSLCTIDTFDIYQECVEGVLLCSLGGFRPRFYLQEGRAFQKTEEFRRAQKLRQTVEHRLARLVQLGIRKARFFGQVKVHFQLLLPSTVANLTLVVGKMGLGTIRPDCEVKGQLTAQIAA